jgi:hypothetical protein
MAWFRRMGLDEVAYHQATVVGREDDHAGQSLDYYGSRGETPLRWGGAGAARLGLPVRSRRTRTRRRSGREVSLTAPRPQAGRDATAGVRAGGGRAQERRGARRTRGLRRDAHHPRCRDSRHDGLARSVVPGAGRSSRAGPGAHGDVGAYVCGHPARHLPGRRPFAARSRARGERGRDARYQGRIQGSRQRRAARHGRGRHHGRPAPLSGASSGAGLHDWGRSGPVREPAALADRPHPPGRV